VDFQPKLKDKRWNKALEPKIFDEWQRKKLYVFKKSDRRKPVYTIDTPPPYVNTPIHVGHAYTYTIMDIIARHRRMKGWRVLFPLGLDKNGLPIEVQAEKKYGINMRDTPRETFIRKCKQMIEKSGQESIDSFQKLGISFNNWKKKYELGGQYDTDDKEYRRLTQETFINLWHKGLVYEDIKPTNYCPECGTTISDAEVEYREDQSTLHYIKFFVKETARAMGEYVTIATTRPELLCACKLILYNPDDVRYLHLEGRTAVVPLYNKEVQIMPHPYAKTDFGTGLVMICSFGDYSDVRILRETDINPTYAINARGNMTRAAGKYKGMKVKEARAAIAEDLKSRELIEKQEPIAQRQPICWRSKNPIEFVPMKEIYLKQVDVKDDMLKIATSLHFFAPESRQILIDWINSINIDWVLSRRRYYGTEVPLWYCAGCKEPVVPPAGKYYQPWKQSSPVKRCPKCNGRKFVGETRTFDTWFDSCSSEYYVLGYLWDKKFWKANMPCSLRPQGKEIIRTWLYFTLLKAWLLDEMQAFKDVWINHHVVDEKGEKMSKSVGNIIDPQEILKKYGAEAFRIWVTLEGDITKGDIRCSFERIEGTSKFLTKLWNIARFISSFPQPEKRTVKLQPADKWILTELNELVRLVDEKYEQYRFNEAANAIRDFAWNVFAAHYLEMVKPRAYNVGEKARRLKDVPPATRAAWYTLHECLRTIDMMLAPIIPFVTDKIWTEMYAKSKRDSIHAEKFPEAERPTKVDKKLAETGKELMEFNSMAWNTKKEKGFSLRDSIGIKVPKKLKPFEPDLKAMHNLVKPEKAEKKKPEEEKEDEKEEPKPVEKKPEPKNAKPKVKPAKKKTKKLKKELKKKRPKKKKAGKGPKRKAKGKKKKR
jgi:valyl-tRNA synthetase